MNFSLKFQVWNFIFLFKINNRNIRERYDISLQLTIKTPERRDWRVRNTNVQLHTNISQKKKSLLHFSILSFFFSKYVYSSCNNSAMYLNTSSYENLHFCILKVPYNQGISCSKKCQLILKYMNSCFIVWTMYQIVFASEKNTQQENTLWRSTIKTLKNVWNV